MTWEQKEQWAKNNGFIIGKSREGHTTYSKPLPGFFKLNKEPVLESFRFVYPHSDGTLKDYPEITKE